MLLFLSIVKLVCEIALMALFGQWVLGLLAFTWIVVTALRIQHCLQIGVELCK